MYADGLKFAHPLSHLGKTKRVSLMIMEYSAYYIIKKYLKVYVQITQSL